MSCHGLCAGAGFISPGLSPGTLTIDGDYEQLPDGALEIEISGYQAGAEHDQLIVTGDAALGGSIDLSFIDKFTPTEGDRFEFLAVEGSLVDAGVEVRAHNLPSTFAFDLDFSDGLLTLTALMQQRMFANLADGAHENARRIGAALDALRATNPEEELIERLDELLAEVGGPFERDVFQAAAPALGPQAHETAMPLTIDSTRIINSTLSHHLAARRRGLPGAMAAVQAAGSAALGPMLASAGRNPLLIAQAIDARNAENSGSPPAGSDRRRNLILQGIGLFQNQSHRNDVQGYRSDSTGALIGMDVPVAGHLDVGMSISYLRTDVRLKGDRGAHEIQTLRVGPYVNWFPEPWFVETSLTYGYQRFDSERFTPVVGAQATSAHEGHDWSLYGGTGWLFDVGDHVQLSVTGSLQYTYLRNGSFRESGVGALEIDSRDADSLRGRIGGHFAYVVDDGDVTFVPEVSLGWERELRSQNHRTTARFVAGGNSFSVLAGEAGEDSAFLGAALTALFSERLSAFVRYDGLYRSAPRGSAHGAAAGVTLRF